MYLCSAVEECRTFQADDMATDLGPQNIVTIVQPFIVLHIIKRWHKFLGHRSIAIHCINASFQIIL